MTCFRVLIACLIALVAAGAVQADLGVYIDQDTYQKIEQLLEVTPEESAALGGIYDDYVAATAILSSRMIELRYSGPGLRAREIREQMLAEHLDPADSPEWRAARLDSYDVWLDVMEDAQRELTRFIERARLIIPEERRLAVNRIGPLVRRESMLDPDDHVNARSMDFQWMPTLFFLIEEAMKDDGELAWMNKSELTPAESQAAAQINKVLLEHEKRVDRRLREYLREHAANARERATTYAILTSELERTDRGEDRIRMWKGVFEARSHEVGEVAAILRDLGDARAADRFSQRLRSAMAPTIFHERWPERMLVWAQRRTDLTPAQLVSIEQLYEQFLVRNEDAENAAFDAGVAAKFHHLDVFGASDRQRDFSEAKFDIRNLVTTTIRQMMSMLTSVQKDHLLTHLQGFWPADHLLFGPAFRLGEHELVGLDFEFHKILHQDALQEKEKQQ